MPNSVSKDSAEGPVQASEQPRAMRGRRSESDSRRLDEAARAGWLYYIAGNTQDEIAAKLGVSRQSAQRLVSLAVSAGLVKVRLDHPIARCLALAKGLTTRYGLVLAEVVPTDPDSSSGTLGLAEATAAEMERRLQSLSPIIMAVGTGRTLKAAVDQLPTMHCPQHRIVSLTGNIASDGSASFYNVIFGMAEAVRARHYPMPLPVIATSCEERDLLHQQKTVRNTLALAAQATVCCVGIGGLGERAPLLEDGFITARELAGLRHAGAVGEIIGWAFDRRGRLIEGLTNARVASAPMPSIAAAEVIGIAKGLDKLAAISGALAGSLINGLITDEQTAEALLAD